MHPGRDVIASDPEVHESLLARQAARESGALAYPRRLPIALARGLGVHVWDTSGRRYIDCLAGAGSLALGHHHPVVAAALRRALDDEVPLTTLDLATPLRDAFTDALVDALPPELADGRILFCGPSGADAVEAAIKLCKTATGRAGVVAFGGGYHGMTQGALSLTGMRAPKERLGALLPDVHHLPFPTRVRCPFGVGGEAGAERCARVVEWALEDDHSGIATPAAVVMEPVQGEGGVHPAPPAFARAVREATNRAGVPLVFDEVQTGLGRTGTLWGLDALGVVPDVLVLSKAIGGGLPLAVVVARPELDAALKPGDHAGTFRGNQLAFAAGAATIRHVVGERLWEHAGAMGSRLRAGLRAAADGIAEVADVRGRGLMVGVELVDRERVDARGVPEPAGARAVEVLQALLAAGVVAEIGGRGNATIRFLPPLVIEPDDVDRVAEAFGRALRA